MGHPMMDLPLGGAIIPREEVKRAPLLKIEVGSILRLMKLNLFLGD